MTTPRVAFLLLALAWPCEASAEAANPLNSSEKSKPDPGPPKPSDHLDTTVVPVVGGSSDVGIGGGFFAGWTRKDAGYVPFAWHVEAAGFITFADRDSHFELPFLDLYAKVTVVRFLGGPTQLEVRPSVTDESALYYYGMGNASSAAPPSGQSSRYFEYGRIHPELYADLRFKLVDHIGAKVGLRYVETIYDIPADSKLADDIRGAPPEVRKLIGPTGVQGAGAFRYGLQLDTRDDETSAQRGTFDEVGLTLSPGGSRDLPFRYGEASIVLRGYIPIVRSRVTFAVRGVGDVLFGDVPFYELSRALDNYAVGGTYGVRGVPAQRYYGKVKVFGNAEVRAKLFDFHAFGKQLGLGSAVFFDGGRVWADTSPHPELDGRGIGLKYGVGAGLRLLSGTAFVLRADVAWSPDATPLSGYVVAGEMF